MLRKSKLILAFMPFMLASCGGNTECAVKRDGKVITTVNTSPTTNYKTVCYNIGVVDGKAVKVTKDIFKAVHSGTTYKAVTILNKVEEGSWTYDKTVDSKTIPSSSETRTSTPVYVAFDKDAPLNDSSDFYCKNTLVTTSTVIIKL